MLEASIKNLFHAKELSAQKIPSVLNAAVHVIEAAIHIAAQVAKPTVIDQNSDHHG